MDMTKYKSLCQEFTNKYGSAYVVNEIPRDGDLFWRRWYINKYNTEALSVRLEHGHIYVSYYKKTAGFGRSHHRPDGPATFEYRADTGELVRWRFFDNGTESSLKEMLEDFPQYRKELLLWL